MFSRFFIDRPIFATVLSIAITLAGGLAVFKLPLAQFPQIAPPTVQIDCNYPGASAIDVAQTVAAPIEQQVNGVEGMMYMNSQCTNDGSYNLVVTFKLGMDLDMAQVLVQNRVNLAMPQLPDVLKQTGVVTKKMSPDIVLSVNVNSPHGRYDQLYLSNYATLHIRDELARLEGVSEVRVLGLRDYSMRIWVDPDKLSVRGLSVNDVVRALREQNAQVACGQLGQQPVRAGQATQLTLTTLGRLKDVKQFEDVVIRAARDGRIVRVKDVAHVELGAKNEDVRCTLDAKPSVGLAIFQLPTANSLDTADRVHAKMHELEQDFPEDFIYEIQYDTTPYTRESIARVFETLRDAVILVALVVLLFLQNWRSAIIPLFAVPVAIVGTFAVMFGFGFSLNNLTLFGLVLAIGIVVDDAIVVVEAVEHHIEQGMQPRAATIQAMSQVSGPVIAVGLVLSAVFIPCAFISGTTGQFFRQFALTIASSTIISTFNSLTLSPALAAILLRSRDKETHEPLPRWGLALAAGWLGYRYAAPWLALHLLPTLPTGTMEHLLRAWPWLVGAACCLAGWPVARLANAILRFFFGLFEWCFKLSIAAYLWTVARLLRVTGVVLVVYAVLLLVTWRSFQAVPKGFVPTQDMGYLLLSVQSPDATSALRTRDIMDHIGTILAETPGVKHNVNIHGNAFLLSAYGANLGSFFVILDDFARRQKPELYSETIAAGLRARFQHEIPDAFVLVLGAPPIRGVGRGGGFKIMIEDREDLGLVALQEHSERLRDMANADPGHRLTGLQSVFRANVPQLFADVDRKKCMTRKVTMEEVFDSLQTFLGSLYVNDFNLFGRTWEVVVQADAPFRNRVETVRNLKVRSATGEMVPMGSVAHIREVNGPFIITRYNMYPASAISGTAGPGVSSGDAIALMADLARRELPKGMTYEWTELSYLELQAGSTAMVIFGFAVVMVFLVLAAQYESWSLPLAVILVVPMCLLSAIAGVVVAHMDINIFTQIGFVVLVGLASKNAILIVEFAKQQREHGVSGYDAALAACKLRLRPIVMTSVAFILGVTPLLVSRGAGAEMRQTLGTAVFSGMLGVTLFGIFLTPVFFVVVDYLGHGRLFSSPAMRRIGAVARWVFALGFVWATFRLLAHRRRSRRNREQEEAREPEVVEHE